MKARLDILVGGIAALFFVSGCDTPYVGSLRKDPSVKAFFSKAPREQMDALRGYDIDKQYAIFMYGNQVVHPPLRFLADPFSARGQEAVDYLQKKIPQADDVTTHYIVVLLSEIATRSKIEVGVNKDLMRQVNQAVQRIDNKDLRTFTEQIVREIRTQHGQMSSTNQILR